MSPKDADGKANTVCQGISVQKLRIITVSRFSYKFEVPKVCCDLKPILQPQSDVKCEETNIQQRQQQMLSTKR